MKTVTGRILSIMNVIAWITFIGLSIKAGAMVISYAVSLFNPEGAKNIYDGLNLFALRQWNVVFYSAMVLMLALSVLLKIFAAHMVIKILSKINLVSPFVSAVALLIEKISYVILASWVVDLMIDLFARWLVNNGLYERADSVSGGYIFVAGVLFVFAQIFKKGVELQNDNELTI
jgi:hypothetical protein